MNIDGITAAAETRQRPSLPLAASKAGASSAKSRESESAVPVPVAEDLESAPAPEQDETVEETRPKTSREEAAKLAERLEEALKDVAGTKVRFNVDSTESGAEAFSFQIIAKDSGEVLREFPEEAVRDLVTREDLSTTPGVIFDEAA